MGGVVEEFVEGEHKVSPSSQCRVNAVGQAQPISTHDQVLGGPTGQVFEGCTFPAHPDYRKEIQDAGMRVAQVLADRGAMGRFATDFVSVADGRGGWAHYAIEVNLRMGGTTHSSPSSSSPMERMTVSRASTSHKPVIQNTILPPTHCSRNRIAAYCHPI